MRVVLRYTTILGYLHRPQIHHSATSLTNQRQGIPEKILQPFRLAHKYITALLQILIKRHRQRRTEEHKGKIVPRRSYNLSISASTTNKNITALLQIFTNATDKDEPKNQKGKVVLRRSYNLSISVSPTNTSLYYVSY